MRDDVGLVFVGLAILFMIAILYGHRRRESFANESNVWDSIQREVEADLQTFLVFDVGTFRANTSDQKKFFVMIDGVLSDAQKLELVENQEKIAAAINSKTAITDQFNTGFDISWNTISELIKPLSGIVAQLEQASINIRSPTQYEDPSVKENVIAAQLKPYFKGTFDLDKPFDTRMALLDAQYAHIIANNAKGQTGVMDIPNGDSDQVKSMMRLWFMMTIPQRHAIPGVKSLMFTIAKSYMSSPYIGLQNAKAVPKTGGESIVSNVFSSIFGS